MKVQIVYAILGVIVITVLVFVLLFFRTPQIGTFNLNDYQYYIDNFSSEVIISDTSNLREIIEKTEEIWMNLYGKDIRNEKPYKVFFDADNGVWLIQGALRTNMMGGVANILIEQSTGKVLAVWHDK